jgi:hypothetical protein
MEPFKSQLRLDTAILMTYQYHLCRKAELLLTITTILTRLTTTCEGTLLCPLILIGMGEIMEREELQFSVNECVSECQ